MKQIAIASEDDLGLEAVVSAHFGRCPFYTMVEVDGTRVVKHWVEANPHLGQHRPGQMSRFIHSLGADVILAGGMGPMAVDLFHSFGMDVATGVSGTVGEAVDAYTGGRLQGIVPCNHDRPESCGGHDQAQTHAEAHPPKHDPGVSPRSLPSRVVVPAQDNSGLSAVMGPRFGRAPWFMVVDVESRPVVESLSNSNDLSERYAMEVERLAAAAGAVPLGRLPFDHKIPGLLARRKTPLAGSAWGDELRASWRKVLGLLCDTGDLQEKRDACC